MGRCAKRWHDSVPSPEIRIFRPDCHRRAGGAELSEQRSQGFVAGRAMLVLLPSRSEFGLSFRIPAISEVSSGDVETARKSRSTEEIIAFLREAEVRPAQGETAGKTCRVRPDPLRHHPARDKADFSS
jgi:hypothetical protein